MSRVGRLLAVVLLLAETSVPGQVAAQGEKRGQRPAQTPPPTFRAGIDQVRLDVVVTDAGEPVPGLTAGDFEVLDNGVPQQVQFATSEGDISILPVLDTSESVRGAPFLQLAAAVNAFLTDLRNEDEVGLITFADRVDLQVLPGRLALVRPAIAASLQRLRPGGLTALRDALSVGLTLTARHVGGSALLVFTDGGDTTSWLSANGVLDAARRSNVVVYAVATGLNRPDSGSRERFLQAAADATGGTVLRVEFGERALAAEFHRIANEFRARYIVSYSPRGVAMDGAWHTLKVRLKGRSGTVRTRNGYFAAGPPSPLHAPSPVQISASGLRKPGGVTSARRASRSPNTWW